VAVSFQECGGIVTRDLEAAILVACTSIRRSTPQYFASMRRPLSKRSTASTRCCRLVLGEPSVTGDRNGHGTIADEFADAAFGFAHAGGGPAQHHGAALPALTRHPIARTRLNRYSIR
jgi:hypothetical protein